MSKDVGQLTQKTHPARPELRGEGWGVKRLIEQWCDVVRDLPLEKKIEAINEARKLIHAVSPMASEPVDCVQWIKLESVEANDYNPNTVAPPEMELLYRSIVEDGYTQPIVGFDRGDKIEVVDGFHRNRVARERSDVHKRVNGYLPITLINSNRSDKADRIAATIRHNRARGKHGVNPMSDIVVELKRRNWSDKKIAKHLGMDPDEILRLCQISGLAEMFTDQEFSEAWESIDPFDEWKEGDESISDEVG